MLDTILTRLSIWQLKLDTIRYLNACDDRQLADMGIERANIVMIARRNARNDKRLRRNASAPPAVEQHRCGLTALTE